ncbi:MAG: bifunctional phosphoglucose/phosphomannose isomerase [candidate division WOR-3 bacterium]|nr:bifunctional phosphoglucose/phosphomannose isomerase [candidate division WOR-3 bacterium]
MNKMFNLIYNLPDQIKDAYNIAQRYKFSSKLLFQPANIVITGMGGSGIGGEIIRSLFWTTLDIPIIISKDYTLPGCANKQSLVFAVSYSGNTEETLESFNLARKRRCPIVAITSGGKLLELCKKYQIDCIQIPSGLPPRSAIGYLFIPQLITLEKIGIIKKTTQTINETINTLITNRQKYNIQARKLARELLNSLPIIYTTSHLFNPVGLRWQAQFNENGKTFCHWNVFPELDHNEIVALADSTSLTQPYYFLILIDSNTHRRNLLRVDLTLKIIKSKVKNIKIKSKVKNIKFKKFYADGKADLTRIFSLIMQGDLISFYLAYLQNIDPMPVLAIDELKKMLARR